MKTPFKVYVDGQSEEIQKHLFTLGYTWKEKDYNDVMLIDKPFLFVDKYILCTDNMSVFKSKEFQELTVDQVLAMEISYNFKPFDKVLVKHIITNKWKCDIFSHINDNDNAFHKFECITTAYQYCIPYEGNEHLAGTVTL